jgi:DNA-directed RNA polymerase specialized sigma24 family protein
MTRQGRRAETRERQALKRAIFDLPQDLRDVFLMHRFARLSYEEIGEKLDLERDEVEAYFAEGMSLLVAATTAPET